MTVRRAFGGDPGKGGGGGSDFPLTDPSGARGGFMEAWRGPRNHLPTTRGMDPASGVLST